MESKDQILRQSPILFTVRIMFLSIVFSFIYFLISLIKHIYARPEDSISIISINSIINHYDLITYFLLLLIQVIISFIIIIKWYTDYWILQKQNIIYKTGIFFVNKTYYKIENIEFVSLNQTMLGKLFDYGTIELINPLLKENIYLTNIGHPNLVLQVLLHRKERDKIIVKGNF